ncbi:hypothetical protein [Sulfurimonas sp.]|uniref:hypothetical protein n=1 Tax=Sulfurimonas sp. TaxID=2022749 RepID=UPI00286D78D8|nr:hypothetical protein [Sulfurimonas sp.]
MAHDQIFTLRDDNDTELLPVRVNLDSDVGMLLIQVFEPNEKTKKKYLRGELIMVQNHILTSTFCDATHFMEEVNLFDYGNDQNKYLAIAEYKKTKNLKLKYAGDIDVFISKSAARAIYKIFNRALSGYSTAAILEKEIVFTPQMLTKLLHEYQFLLK